MDLFRIRLQAPPGRPVQYRSADSIHDAAISLLTSKGIHPDRLIGRSAGVWSCAPLFSRPIRRKSDQKIVKHCVLTTVEEDIAEVLRGLRPQDLALMHSKRALTDEEVSFAGWRISYDPAPIVPGVNSLECLMGSPLAIQRKEPLGRHVWHRDVRDFDVSGAVNSGLFKRTGRKTNLTLLPDLSYVRSRETHSVCTKLKAERSGGSVVGMSFPFLLSGSEEDLCLAWYAGLGSKTRMGFGIITSAQS